jgi:hypothetical protein
MITIKIARETKLRYNGSNPKADPAFKLRIGRIKKYFSVQTVDSP